MSEDDVLRRLIPAREAVDPELRRLLTSIHADMARICGYHFGWCNPAGEPLPHAATGKALRPALALLGGEAGPGGAGAALPMAVAVELVHDHSLIHDDVLDQDDLRRGRPTAWSVFGVGPAVLAGDVLLALAYRSLAENADPAHVVPAIRMLAGCVSALLDGQSGDLQFESRDPAGVSVPEYLEMAEAKTGRLLSCAMAGGALLAGASPDVVAALDRAGRHLGVAWQAADDIENIWGDPASTGKPAMGDLRQGKPTLPVLMALSSGGPQSRDLRGLLQAGPAGDVSALADHIEAAGGLTGALELSERHLNLALVAIVEAALPTRTSEQLGSLFRHVAGKSVRFRQSITKDV